jgi:hypothetical protein
MSIKEIKEHLKDNIDKLSASDAKLAARDLDTYFTYLQARREMPKNAKLDFEQYHQLLRSLQQADKGKLIPPQQVFAHIRKKYGFNS